MNFKILHDPQSLLTLMAHNLPTRQDQVPLPTAQGPNCNLVSQDSLQPGRGRVKGKPASGFQAPLLPHASLQRCYAICEPHLTCVSQRPHLQSKTNTSQPTSPALAARLLTGVFAFGTVNRASYWDEVSWVRRCEGKLQTYQPEHCLSAAPKMVMHGSPRSAGVTTSLSGRAEHLGAKERKI